MGTHRAARNDVIGAKLYVSMAVTYGNEPDLAFRITWLVVHSSRSRTGYDRLYGRGPDCDDRPHVPTAAIRQLNRACCFLLGSRIRSQAASELIGYSEKNVAIAIATPPAN